MERDLLLAAVERRRNKSSFDLFLESPWRAVNQHHSLLYVLAAVLAVGGSVLAYYLGMELANIGIMAFVLFILPPGFFNLFETNRIKRVEAEFPAMLRDISISVKSGMTLKAAVSFAAQGQYGALTKAVRQINNMISWGSSFEEAMLHFAPPLSHQADPPHHLHPGRGFPDGWRDGWYTGERGPGRRGDKGPGEAAHRGDSALRRRLLCQLLRLPGGDNYHELQLPADDTAGAPSYRRGAGAPVSSPCQMRI